MEAGHIYEYFESNVNKFPKKAALIYLGEKHTFAELKALVERFAAGLYQLVQWDAL